MALDAPAPLYYDTNATQTNTAYSQDDMASLVASTSNGGFPGLSTQEQYQHQQYQQAQQLHAQAQAQAASVAAQQQQQPPGLPQSLAGVGRRHRTVPAKTFKCTGFGDCAMVFSRSEHLARHVRKHTGERPFACHCSKQFSRLDNLRQHAQTVHADRPELNARMMARLVEVQGTMASLSKAAAASSIPTASTSTTSPSSSRPNGPPRSLSLSLSLSLPDNSTPHHQIKTEHPTTTTDSFALSLQQRKSRRPGAPLTLSSADIAAANLGAGFHLQGHATAPLPRGHSYHGHGGHLYAHNEGSAGLYTHHESHHGQQHPHSASAHQTHFPSDIHEQAHHQYSLDAIPSHSLSHHNSHAHHLQGSHHPHSNTHHHLFTGRPARDFTQSEYAVSSHAHGGSPAHEFPFHASINGNGHVNGVRSQALPSPPYSAASASGYFPSMHQSEGFTVKQEDSPELAGFDLFNQHPSQHQGHQHEQPAYASPPITPHLANFPSLTISGSGAGSASPHSAFSGGEGSGSPVLGSELVGVYGAGDYDAVSGGGSVYDGVSGNGSGSGSGYEGSLSPEQVFVGVGAEYLHEQHFADGQQQQNQQECFEQQQSQQDFYPDQQQFDQQQQQQFFAPQQNSQQQRQQQQQQDRWMAQQQYRREHGFAA